MRETVRTPRASMLFAGVLALLAACSGDSAPPQPRIDLLAQAERAVWSGGPGAGLEGSVRVLETLGGLAVVEVDFDAGDGVVVATPSDAGGEYLMYRWPLPLPVSPEILSRSEEPQLGGFDLPRLADPSLAIDGERGVFYAGPDDLGAPCLLVVVPKGTPLPRTFPLRYATEAARLVGSELLPEADRGAALRGRRADGDRTNEGWVVATGARVRVPLPPHADGRFRARLTAEPAAGGRTIALTFAGDLRVERAFLATGGAVELSIDLPATERETEVDIEVQGASGSLVYLEEPRFERRASDSDSDAGAEMPPNVCLVLIDTLRADRLRPDLMPSVSALADESLVFEDCWSTCSWTLPSVTTMLTSNHGGQHQAWLNNQPLAEGIDTLAEVFRRNGYRTAAFTGGVFVDQIYGLDRGFSTFDSSAGGVAAVTERALSWLDRADEGPWFLLVHTYEVHAPYQPPDEAYRRVLERHPGVLAERAPEPQAFHDEHGVIDGDPDAVAALLSDLYDEGVRYTDGVVGEFVDTLGQRGLLDRTVLALTSDHGEEFGEHGMLGHTDSLYSEQLRVPLFLRFPGGARAGSDERPVSHLDLAPTLLDAAGLSPDVESFAGHSLLGGAKPSPVYATRNIEEVGVLRAMCADGRAFIDGPYIYPGARAATGPELYDLATDPQQANNLFGTVGDGWNERLDGLSERYDAPKVRAVRISSALVLLELQEMGYL